MKMYRFKQLGLIGFISFLFSLQGQATDVSGIIDTDTVWNAANSPYNVTGNMLVKSGIKLTIEAGVEVNFTGAYHIGLDGVLEAVGTETNPILFTGTGWKGLELDTSGSIIAG